MTSERKRHPNNRRSEVGTTMMDASARPSLEGLLRTKLHMPGTPAWHLARTRLWEKLDGSPACRLTTVAAPPGYGKTTLVSVWIRERGWPSGWLSLDGMENDPLRFWRYMAGAAERALGSPLGGGSAESGIVSAESLQALILDALIDYAEREEAPLVLALDDYHVIQAPAIHEALHRWIERLPSPVRLVLLSRHGIPMPLAGWRANGRLQELDMRDLRFNEEETIGYWRLQWGREPDGEALARWMHRTEGWAAMLRLMTISSAAEGGPSEEEAVLSGRSRRVSDYLMEEAYGRLPEEMKRFLRRTSILDRLCASLCAEVANDPGAEERLGELERIGMFLIPLDDERRWFRYHHLFGEFLRDRLRREQGEAEPELHAKAARWHQSHGYDEEAVEHAFASGDVGLAAEWIERKAHVWLKLREIATLRGWLERIPAPFANRPELVLLSLWIDLMEGRTAPADERLRRLNEALEGMKREGNGAAYARMHEEVRIAENFAAVRSGDFDLSLSLIRGYGERNDLPDRDTPLLLSLGLELNEGAVPFIRGAFGFEGSVARAESYHRAYGYFLSKNGLQEFAYTSYQQTAMAEVSYLRNRLAEAREYVEEALRLAKKNGTAGAFVPAALVRSDLWAAEGEEDAALAEIDEAMRELRRRHWQTTAWYGKLDARRVYRRLLRGDREPAVLWADDYVRRSAARKGGRSVVYPDDEDFAYARIRFALGETEAAATAARSLLRAAVDRANPLSEVQACLLLCEISAGRGAPAESERHLLQALKRACPDDIARPFLDAGPPVAKRLSEWANAAPVVAGLAPSETEFARRLASAAGYAPGEPERSPGARSLESLTPREREVLACMARGMSNKAIASELYLTEGTVKLHLHRIYGKLGAEGRVQAIRIAERLGLLEAR